MTGFANTALRRAGRERQGCRCTYPDLDQPEDCSRAIKEIRRAAKTHSEDWQRGAGQNKGLLRALLQSKLALLLTTLLDSGLYGLLLLWGHLELKPHRVQYQENKEDFSEFCKPKKLGGKG